jgi:L-histidine N-alpha-methyltransferase
MSQPAIERLRIDVCLDPQELTRIMAEEVRAGLTAPQKRLPSKYFYDARGSELFERITELPEYYQTRTELGILRSIADGLIADLATNELVELGSGSSTKTRVLLDAMERAHTLRRYLPFDVSAEMLQGSCVELLERYASSSVHAVVGDFQRHLGAIPPMEGSRLVIFLGSTIGNLEADERARFLGDVRRLLGERGSFLLGVDLVKDVRLLHAAYNDAAGVTAEFNRNILRVVNNGLDADFDPEAYRHIAFYDADKARIEMHLASEREQQVRVRKLGLQVAIKRDETIWTEISCKFTRQSTASMLAEAGLNLRQWYTDPEDLFALALASPA